MVYDDEKRLLGLKITTFNATILVLNVYLPYQSDDNVDEYQAILGKIQAITDSFDSSNIFIVGDFNADLIKTSLFSPFLNSFISECHFIPSDIKYLPPDSFTYVSDAHGSRSWLDHVLCTHSSHSSVSDMVINYDCVSSDHFPLSFTISIKLLPTSESSTTQQTCKSSPMWDCASSHDLLNYYNNSGSLLSGIDVPHAALSCTNPNCHDVAHQLLLCKFYNDIIHSLTDASDVIPTKTYNTSRKFNVPGWNDLVRDSHQAARETFLIWRSAGSPRHGSLYDLMKIKRAQFKRNKRHCEKNAESLKAERLASNLSSHDFKNFWKGIKQANNARLPNPSNVGGACGAENVRNMWLQHYQSLLNSVPESTVHIHKIDMYCSNIQLSDNMVVKVKELQKLIIAMPVGKACGYDHISNEHFKHANEKLHILMSLLYSSLLIHGFLPDTMMTTIIAPIIKNKSGDLSDNNNYRPIALATVASKLFESLILSRAIPFLITCDNQFGFKKHHSTEMLIFLLKELFRNYIANGSSMYVTMLDASKAFDKVNHSKLFGKLIDRGCPAFIVRILYHWYSTQQFTIRWCQGFSSFFTVSNGVKQGGILSPHLFNVYMDDLSVNLNKLYIGCLYAGTLINHLMYADDLCIFSPSVAGLRKLTDCCAKYGELFNITYNAKKSFCMVIDNQSQDRKHFHCIHLDNHPLPYTTKCKYLGHIINNNLTDDDDIARQKRCLYAQANVLARKFCLCNISTKIILFQAYCAPMYTSSLWCTFKKYSLKSITVAFNNSLRILLNLPSRCSASFMFATNYIKSFNERIRSSIFSLLCRLHQSDNILFINYLHTDIHFKSHLYSYWRSLLYSCH